MPKIQCKMCGGTIEIPQDKQSCVCEYCGNTVTLPKINSDEKERLYARAEHFRQNKNFDKAITAYEELSKLDGNDPEIFWGIVLSRFGIEYVEDPKSWERIPTCHRVQFDSILQDPDYLTALELSTGTPEHDLYEREAERIAEIQKGILKISAQEKPYDVFICFKQTTDGGTRTRDSVDAQEIYSRLTNAGLRVFFSPISLEGKIGREYEPFIFAALNSAKVMLVIGSKLEYFNAPWVRNEWGRFLVLLKKDRSRVLIPCYKDMTAYDLPEELSVFQALDMSKIGFIQDLQHAVKKLVAGTQDGGNVSGGNGNAGAGAGTNLAKKIKRIHFFISEGEWQKADEYCEQCLDEDMENAEIYLLKTQVEFKCADADLLFMQDGILESKNFQRAERFSGNADRVGQIISEIKEKYNVSREFIRFANSRLGYSTEEECQEILDKAAFFSEEEFNYYQDLVRAEDKIINFLDETEETYFQIIEYINEQKFVEALKLTKLIRVRNYRSLDAKKKEILEGIFQQAVQLRDEKKFDEAIALFQLLADSDEEIEECKKREEEEIQECKRREREEIYNQAVAARERGEFDLAISLFEKLTGTEKEIEECYELKLIETLKTQLAKHDWRAAQKSFSIRCSPGKKLIMQKLFFEAVQAEEKTMTEEYAISLYEFIGGTDSLVAIARINRQKRKQNLIFGGVFICVVGLTLWGIHMCHKEEQNIVPAMVEIPNQNYAIGKYEITQKEYESLSGTNPSYFKGKNLPVENVSWNDAMKYCERLTAWERKKGLLPKGKKYTLPTSKQWEIACRAGTKTKFCSGDTENDLQKVAWYYDNSGTETHSVGTKEPNAWGIYDMHGNVWEWCLDARGSERVNRGGGWFNYAVNCGSSYINSRDPDERRTSLGFRVALVPDK